MVNISVAASVPPAGPLSSGIVPSATSGPAPLTVSFSGSANGGAAPYSYSWMFGDGGSSNSQSPSHSYASAGTYTAILTVTDSASKSARSTVSIIVGTAASNGTKYSLRQIVLLRKKGKK
jgi:PKD repeat protein